MSLQLKGVQRAVIAAFLVASGLSIIWGMLNAWLLASLGAFGDAPEVTEQISMTSDGTPVVEARSVELGYSRMLSRRTLEGKPWPLDDHYLVQGGSPLMQRVPPDGLVQLPIDWGFGRRVFGLTDGSRQPTDWYMISDDAAARHCYLAGFDAISKLPAGYIARNGFRAVRPELNEQFTLPESNADQLSTFLAGDQASFQRWWGIVFNHALAEQGRSPPAWVVYLVEAGRMWEIDLRQRTARAVFETPGLVSVASVFAWDVSFSPPAAAAKSGKKKSDDYARVIAARTDDKIVLYDPETGNHRDFALPAQVAHKPIELYWVTPEQLVIEFDDGKWSGGPVKRLLWTSPTGKIERAAEVKLAGQVPDNVRQAMWTMSCIIPVSIAWLVGAFVAGPLVMIQNHSATGFASALAQCIGAAWPPLVAVLVVSGILAWVTLRLHEKYRRPWARTWAAFVFLLGIPGFVAYLVEHRRTKLEACQQCGDIVPRDREACADCNTAFAPPPPIGTEIFA